MTQHETLQHTEDYTAFTPKDKGDTCTWFRNNHLHTDRWDRNKKRQDCTIRLLYPKQAPAQTHMHTRTHTHTHIHTHTCTHTHTHTHAHTRTHTHASTHTHANKHIHKNTMHNSPKIILSVKYNQRSELKPNSVSPLCLYCSTTILYYTDTLCVL